jgi:hypothetical protein
MNDGWEGPPLGGAGQKGTPGPAQINGGWGMKPRVVVPDGHGNFTVVEPNGRGGGGASSTGEQPQKHDQQKTRLELIPPEFLEGVGKVLTFGAKKYAAGNWASGDGFDWSRLYGALLRHMMAWANGEDVDPESGLSHLYHAGCMLAFLAAHVERGMGTDDRATIGIRKQGK